MRREFVDIGMGTAIGVISYLFGEIDNLFLTLLFFMAIDYISGLVKAAYNKNIDSQIGAKGILKKIAKLIIISIAYRLSILTGQDVIRGLVIGFYISNEGISILENLGEFIELPTIITEALKQLQKGGDVNGNS